MNDDPLLRLSMETASDQVALAAGAAGLIAEAELRLAVAEAVGVQADSPEARLAAYLEADAAVRDQIRVMTADSRADWELDQMANGQL